MARAISDTARSPSRCSDGGKLCSMRHCHRLSRTSERSESTTHTSLQAPVRWVLSPQRIAVLLTPCAPLRSGRPIGSNRRHRNGAIHRCDVLAEQQCFAPPSVLVAQRLRSYVFGVEHAGSTLGLRLQDSRSIAASYCRSRRRIGLLRSCDDAPDPECALRRRLTRQ